MAPFGSWTPGDWLQIAGACTAFALAVDRWIHRRQSTEAMLKLRLDGVENETRRTRDHYHELNNRATREINVLKLDVAVLKKQMERIERL